MDFYTNLLVWLIENPLLSIPIVMVEFAVCYWLYYRLGEHPILKIIFGVWFQPQNFIVNTVAMSIICLDPPRETTTTARLKRYKYMVPENWLDEWRVTVADTIGHFLNRWDPGHY